MRLAGMALKNTKHHNAILLKENASAARFVYSAGESTIMLDWYENHRQGLVTVREFVTVTHIFFVNKRCANWNAEDADYCSHHAA